MRFHLTAPLLVLCTALAASPSLGAADMPPAADAAAPKSVPKGASPKAPARPAPATPAAKAPAPVAKAAPAVVPPRPSVRELHVVATVDATQTWKKNDPKYPGEQWSTGSAQQRYEIRTQLQSEGKLELRNLLDPDLPTRMEAKTIFLARQAKKMLEKPGQTFKLPKTEQEKAALTMRMREELSLCDGQPACRYEKELFYAAIFAAMAYPEAMEEDTEPGRYLYFLPFKGCPEYSRVTLKMAIDGVRYNKDVDKFIPFSERHSADTINADEGISLCSHFTAVIDTQDKDKPMYQETIFVPRPVGLTEYTENGHTSREQQPQPVVTAAIDWMNAHLRHASSDGKASVSLPLALPLNQNATWLGLWTGTAKVTMEWTFREVPASASASQP